MAIKFNTRSKAEITAEIDKVIAQSLGDNIAANQNFQNDKSTSGIDAFLAENDSMRQLLNKRIGNKLRRLGYKDIPEIVFEGVEDNQETNQRVLNTTNSACKVYTCADMMNYVYNECPGLVDFITYKSGDVCPEQFPSVVQSTTRTLTAVAEGALPADVSADYEIQAVPSANDYIVCHKFETPDPLAMAVKMTKKRLKCDMCLDILALVLIDFPRRLRTTQNNQILSLLTTGTNFVQGSSNLYQILTSHIIELENKKVNAEQAVHLMARSAFENLRNIKGADGHFLFPYTGQCPRKYCVECINGYKVMIVDSIPVGGVPGANTSQVISADLGMIVGRGTDMQKCEYNENQSCLGNKVIEAWADFQVAVPLNLSNKFLYTNVTF
jgi:hypothetical protein